MIKVLQITDPHIMQRSEDTLLGVNTEKYFIKVLEHAHHRNGKFDLLLLTGDLAQDPCPESYQRIQHIVNQYETPCICLPGNHDDFGQMQSLLNTGSVSCARQKQLENWQIICLNSQKPGEPGGHLSSGEISFLRQQLQEHQDLYALIAVHHHSISSGSSWMDAMMIDNSDALFDALADHPQVKAITCGHVHQMIAKNHNGIDIYAAPASCFQFKPECQEFALDDKSPGYLLLELHDNGRTHAQAEWLPIQLNELIYASDGY